MNKSKYRYQELDLPNVLLECPLASISSVPPTIMPDWHTLIYTVAKKKPNWVVVVPYGQSRVARFLIQEQDEVLGQISREQMYSGEKFVVKPVRGPTNKTKDPKKAAALVFRNFARQTLPEILTTATQKAVESVYQVTNGIAVDTHVSEEAVHKNIGQYIRDNWPAIEAAAIQNGGNKVLVQAYPERVEKRAASQRMVHKLSQGRVVVLRDSNYYVCDPNGLLQHTYVDTTLPPYYKKAVGMLKLVDPKEMVAGYGVRATDNIFYVCEEENET